MYDKTFFYMRRRHLRQKQKHNMFQKRKQTFHIYGIYVQTSITEVDVNILRVSDLLSDH